MSASNENMKKPNITKIILMNLYIISTFRHTHLDLAAATQFGWSSGSTPFPIGVGRKGSPVTSTNSLTSLSALAYAAPAPQHSYFSLRHHQEILDMLSE